MSDTARRQAGVARGLVARLRDPRRLAGIVLLGISAGTVAAFLIARGPLAGSDAYAYWTGVHNWLAGQDIYHVIPGNYIAPSQGALPYAYAPWSLYVFLPWALLPWNIAWIVWRLANVVLFACSVAWAYDRRPLGTALIFIVLAPSLAANLDTGNVNVFIALTPWLAWLISARWGGVGWAIGTALKFVPAPLLFSCRARRGGSAWAARGLRRVDARDVATDAASARHCPQLPAPAADRLSDPGVGHPAVVVAP